MTPKLISSIKMISVIDSCTNLTQLKSAENMFGNYCKQFIEDGERNSDIWHQYLMHRIQKKFKKLNTLMELDT